MKEGPGQTRPPFIIKEPSTMAPLTAAATATTKAVANHVIKSFVFVTDMTPTFLDFAKVSPPGPTYKGHEVHPIMGKSIKPLLDGTVDRVHAINEPSGTEMFNSTGLYMDDWEAIWDGAHPTGKWQLYNIVKDAAQNNNVADQNLALIQKMIAAYQNYSKNVGIVIPRGEQFAFQVSHFTPALNEPQTVVMYFILPEELVTAKALLQNGTFSLEG
jgi:arylsulfatase